ncbi:hypothetical protein [Oligoflexus tunisiensis]|uniref:hypothetical protein n=1 Tax=Oligoflexus tunisiensis TaxID=708132 RepID=UPI000B2816AD|nr:hypothetical protein [Oligoflexus tunisiensis]
MRKLIFVSALSMSIGSVAIAHEEEHMEVTAPNECCTTPLPGGLGMLAGWVGASGPSGAASLKEAALKAAITKAAKQKSKKEEKKEAEKNEYDKATDGKSNNDSLYRELGLTFRQLFDNGGRLKVKQTVEHPDGRKETLEIEDCVPSGPLNPKELNCTMQKFELFTDPTDGVERWALTLAVVEPAYNPKHYDANARGWYPKVIDDQTFTIVFETEADLFYQLDRIDGR